MENPLSQNLLFLVMADISAIGPQRVKESYHNLVDIATVQQWENVWTVSWVKNSLLLAEVRLKFL